MNTLKNQLSRHSVALVSLVIALTSLAYNTWRNEQTEENRNVRAAGIEVLLKLGEVDRVVFYSHYDRDDSKENPRTGWAYVLTVRDMASLMHEPARTSGAELVSSWQANWSGLGNDDKAANTISDAIDKARNDVLEVLAALD
ncbi:MAG: hypothetical protein R3192_04570 [Woeseiaceae bacterium]|nr:hypothetical protein [Woeseiaceae bacterium]